MAYYSGINTEAPKRYMNSMGEGCPYLKKKKVFVDVITNLEMRSFWIKVAPNPKINP